MTHPHIRYPHSKTVHDGNPEVICRGKVGARSTPFETDEPINCALCVGRRINRPPKQVTAKQVTARPVSAIPAAGPLAIIPAPPVAVSALPSAILRDQAMCLLTLAIKLEASGL